MFIREKLGFMMYNNGKGEVITKTEYLRWKFRNNQKVFLKKKSLFKNVPSRANNFKSRKVD